MSLPVVSIGLTKRLPRMQKVLVTGGAGYVGSHTCLRLAEAGFEPVVYDNLSNGHQAFVRWGPFEQGDICEAHRLDEVFAKHRPVAVLHFAALIEVGESVKHPDRFYANNVAGALNLIEAARRAGVDKFVFSSTCATYGEPRQIPMDETHPQVPLNPYGRSKLMVEQMLQDFDRHLGFRSICLRYFNAAGADFEGRIGEWHDPETHAIPLAIRAAMGGHGGFKLFGVDYPTRDGTAVRRKDSAVKVVPQPWPAFASPHLLEASFRRGARSDRDLASRGARPTEIAALHDRSPSTTSRELRRSAHGRTRGA